MNSKYWDSLVKDEMPEKTKDLVHYLISSGRDTHSLQMMTLQSSALPKTWKRFLSMFWVTLAGRLWM